MFFANWAAEKHHADAKMQRRSRGSTHPNLKSPTLPGHCSHYPAVLFQNASTQTGTQTVSVCLFLECHVSWLSMVFQSFGIRSRDPTTSWYTARNLQEWSVPLSWDDKMPMSDMAAECLQLSRFKLFRLTECPSRAQDLQDPFWDRKTTSGYGSRPWWKLK